MENNGKIIGEYEGTYFFPLSFQINETITVFCTCEVGFLRIEK